MRFMPVKNELSLPLLKATDVQYSRQNQVILENINLAIEKGQITTIIGPNGAGKSTLIKLFLNILKPDKGYIHQPKNLKLGYMPQHFSISPFMPISVKYFLDLYYSAGPVYNFASLINFMKIEELLVKQMRYLSGGEKQRVLLARALMNKPDILILDEPTANLDIQGQAEFYDWLEGIRHEFGCAIILVSHDLHWVMASSDQIICLNRHICCFGHPTVVRQHEDFKNLFGTAWQQKMGFYEHHHDHHHS